MTHFYLTLPSNSSQQFFPNNTLTDFTTKLASTLELTGEWEVGLAEMMFPRSWYTIPKSGLYIDVDIEKCNAALNRLKQDERKRVMTNQYSAGDDAPPKIHIVRLFVTGDFYHSMEELINQMNNAGFRAFIAAREHIGDSINLPTFFYRATARKLYVTLPAGMSVKFPPILESILGFSPEQNPICNAHEESTTVRADLSCDLQAGIHALYVYCDLLQFTYVGDIKAPLLRVVNSGGEAGDVVTRYYERPRYIPLQKKNFDSIQIIIRDDLGEKIQFENGKVLVTLHFRRTQNQYLI